MEESMLRNTTLFVFWSLVRSRSADGEMRIAYVFDALALATGSPQHGVSHQAPARGEPCCNREVPPLISRLQ